MSSELMSTHESFAELAQPAVAVTGVDQSASVSRALRWVLTGMLVGMLWKFRFFLGSDQVYLSIPVYDDFFPSWLQNIITLRVAFIGSVTAMLTIWMARDRNTQRIAAAAGCAAQTVMLLHQGSYNDMTFVTVWWCNVWVLWFLLRVDVDPPTALLRKAAFLSRLILSVILLGGAAGKWTGEYWSGEALFEIYFRDRDFWCFNLLRSWLDAESLRAVATAYSRHVILVETIAGLTLWLLPARWAAVLAAAIFSSIALFSNFLLFSVIAPLIGLSAVGLLVPRAPKDAS